MLLFVIALLTNSNPFLRCILWNGMPGVDNLALSLSYAALEGVIFTTIILSSLGTPFFQSKAMSFCDFE